MVLGALGFAAGGIAASSIASSMMSAAAVANGGGVAAGSLVATLQSAGECPGCHQPQSLGAAACLPVQLRAHPLSLLQVLRDSPHQPMPSWEQLGRVWVPW